MALFQYNLGSEIPFSSIDYGFINETPTTPSEDHGDLAVVAQTTIAPDDIVSTYSGSLSTVTITNTGSGVGEFGGFNVARHIKFTGAGTRAFTFAFDTSNREEITFSVIRGTDSNGGELPDSGEDLLFEYSTNGGSTWTGTQVLAAYNDTAFNNLNDVTVTLPTAARVSNAQFRIRQASNSGSNYDQWGVTAVTIGGEILTTEDYGFLTPARQTVPYGRLKIVQEFADDRLLRNSVGGIEFTLGGKANIFTLPIHVGRGFLRLDGKEFTRITLRYIGSGTFSHFGGSAEAVSNATPAQTPLFTVAGVATEKFGKGNYTATGQFSAFTGAAEVVSISGATRQDLFRIRGAAHDTHTENYVGEGRLFAVQGASEAFKVEEKASGLFSFKGTSKETIQSNNVVSVETQISGSGSESITPAVRPGSGEATFSGAITNEHVRFHQFGTGTLSSFSGTAETSNRVVFSYNESSVVNAETLDYGLITEGFADEPISNYANVPISTLANEVVSEFGRYPNREEFGHISIDPEQSIHTPGYNHVDYGYINTTNRFPFGKFQSEDGGDLTYESAQIGIRVRPITPGPTLRLEGTAGIFTLPIHKGEGYFRFEGKSVVRIRAVYYGSGKFSNFGGSAEATSNADSGRKILFRVAGDAHAVVRFVYIGEGSLFTFVSKTESTSVTEKPQALYKFTGSAVEKNTENYVGTGSLFTFVSSTDSTVINSAASGLFTFKGSGIEKNTENYVGQGSLFTFVSKSEATVVQSVAQTLFRFTGAITNEHVRFHQFGTGTFSAFSGTAYHERVAFDYNEDSIVNVRHDNYGLITEGSADQPISDFANDPISLYANEQVSEFGRFANREDFGHISIDPEQSINTHGHRHDDYGYINTTNRFPFGGFTFEDENEGVDTAGIRFQLRAPTSGTELRLQGQAEIYVLPVHIGGGITRFAGDATIRIRAVYYGSGKFSNFGGSAEAISNVDSGRQVLFRVSGDSHNTIRFVEVGTGSLFTFVSKTESTSVTEKPQVLYKFTGSAVEKNTESYVGKGSLFTFVSSTESTVINSAASGLFSIKGSAEEKNTEVYVGKGSLFTFVSKSEATVVQSKAQGLFKISGAITNEHVRFHQFGTGTFSTFSGTAYHERVAFDYNEDSIVNVDHENYGFITQGSADQPISDFANDPISLYANEQVSEFGRFSNREDFGHISIDPEQSVNTHGWNHIDYGYINTTNRFPFGGFTFDDGSVTSATSKLQVKLPVEGPVFQISGVSDNRVLPVIIGGGFTRLGGDALVKITAVWYGSGSVFSFVGGAEATSSTVPTEAPLLDFNGTARERFGKGNYDASGTFSTFSGAGETAIISNKADVLFDVNGTAIEKHTENYVGEGSLFGFVSATESTVINSAASGLFKFQGGAIEKNTENYVGTGSLFAFDSSTEATEVLSTASGLFKFSGAATNVQVRFHQFGTGSLFGFNGGAESVTFDYSCHGSIVNIGADNYGFITESVVDQTITDYANEQISTYANEVVSDFGIDPNQESFGHISIDPEQSINTHGWNHEDYGLITEPEGGNKFPCVHLKFGGERFNESRVFGYAGSGTFSTFSGAAEARAIVPPSKGLFKVHGSGGIIASLSHIGSGEIHIGDSGIDKFIKVQFSPPTTGVLFKFSGGLDVSGVNERPSDLKATFAEVGHAKLRIAGDAFTTFHLGHIGSGQLDINGNAIEKHTEAYVGSGSLFAFTGGAESFTVDLPEFATLFRFAGNAVEKNTENYVGTGSLFTFVSKTESTTSAEQPKVLFNIEGASVNRILFHYYGTGNFSTFGGAAEARAVTKEAGGLFTFSGNAPESITPAPHIGSGSLFTFVGKTEAFVASDDLVAPPLFKIGGDAIIGFSLGIIGRGGLDVLQKVTKLDVEGKNRFVGAQERRAINNPASVLFSIDGNVKIFFVFQETGGGFTRVAGEAFTEVTPRHTGRGKTSLHGEVTMSASLSHIGSGTIFGFVGGAESRAIDLPPQKGLLRFAGTAPEVYIRGPELGDVSLQLKSSDVFVRFKLSHISDGSRIHVDGDGAEARVRPYEGSGTLFGFSGATEARTIDLPPQVPTLFRFAGNSGERETNAHLGSGSLFGFDSATEVRVASPELSGLFKVQGTGAEAKTKVFTGSGVFDLNTKTDGLDTLGKQVYISAPESTTVNPPEHTQVFTFSGSAVATEDRAYQGTGTLFGFTGAAESRAVVPDSTGLFKVQGSGEESRSRIYSGTGRVFGFTGGAEATAVTENVPGSLFKFTGEVTVVRRFPPHVGSGTLFSFTGATESQTIAPPVATLFEFNGNVAESRSRVYTGSGTLVTFKSATIARRVPYDVTQGLFKLVGALNESFVPSGYVGTTGVQFIGASTDRRIEFESPKPTQIYIV